MHLGQRKAKRKARREARKGREEKVKRKEKTAGFIFNRIRLYSKSAGTWNYLSPLIPYELQKYPSPLLLELAEHGHSK